MTSFTFDDLPDRVKALATPHGAYVIEVMGTATELWQRPGYVTFFDPDTHGGLGTIVFAKDRETAALRFDDPGKLLDCWRLQSETTPLRDDGLPNRPLTAYTIMMKGGPC